jgi:hypothetical protein
MLALGRTALNEVTFAARKVVGLRDLALIYAQAGIMPTAKQLLLEARILANQVEFVTDRVTALSAVAGAFAQIGERQLGEEIVSQARKIAAEVEDNDYRAAAFHAIAEALVPKSGTLNAATRALLLQAQIVAEEIEMSYRKARALCTIASALARTGDDDTALELLAKARTVTAEIDNIDYRAEALREIAEAYTGLNQKEPLLNLVQTEWFKANTRHCAIKLLSLATDLIPHQSALGQQFYEAFDWVDAFLKG